jgi:DnaJ homolog subfamily A member 2
MDFFGNFFQHAGPGMQQQIPQQQQGPVDNERLYKFLSVSKTATDKEIRKAYLKMSMKGDYRHPDKGGTEENFQKLSQAYEILSDTKKRKDYDQFGEDVLKSDFKERQAAATGPMGLHNMFFGGRGRQQQQSNAPKKGKPTTFNLKLSLEDLCKNTTKKIKITRKVVFDIKSNHKVDDALLEKTWDNCQHCKGTGTITQMRQIGPGFVQRSQSACSYCSQAGCKLKAGYQLREIQEIITIFVEKGSTNGTKIKFEQKGNVIPGKIPGDLIVVVHERKHQTFTRKENDLLIKKQISIDEALCSHTFYIRHPDDRILNVQMDSTSLITSKNNLRCLEGCGMPIKGNNFTFGRLFIYFEIVFPKFSELHINSNTKTMISNIFSRIPNYKKRIHRHDFTPTIEELKVQDDCTLIEVDMSEFGIKTKKTKSANDSDSDDDQPQFINGMHPTQCRQM